MREKVLLFLNVFNASVLCDLRFDYFSDGTVTINDAEVDVDKSGVFGNGGGRLLVVEKLPFKISEDEVKRALRRRCSPKNQFSSEFFRETVNALKANPHFTSIVSYIQCSSIPGETIGEFHFMADQK